MNDNHNTKCEICETNITVIGDRCCNGVDCDCKGVLAPKDDETCLCVECIDSIDQMNQKGFTVMKNGVEFDVYQNTAEVV